MSQRKTPAGTPSPPRAEPLQPDRPGRGDKRTKTEDSTSRDSVAEKQHEQSKDALDNVREGYD